MPVKFDAEFGDFLRERERGRKGVSWVFQVGFGPNGPYSPYGFFQIGWGLIALIERNMKTEMVDFNRNSFMLISLLAHPN